MIYKIARKIVQLALFIFFRKIVVSGQERIPSAGPLIIVANHPNTLMDPLLVASITKQRVGFLGNASIFVNRILNSIFSYFHVIPVYRKKDVGPGEKPDNAASFERCHKYLNNGGTLLIFPEGSSYYELKLREIKTGTARIALSYESLIDYKGYLKIIPIALDYSDSLQFRSMVSITICKPILVADFRDEYTKDEYRGVTLLTEAIRESLAKYIPQTSGKEQEQFLLNVHRFYTTFYEPEADLYSDTKRSLYLRNQLSSAIQSANDSNPDLYRDTEIKINSFYNSLHIEGLTAGFFREDFQHRNKWMLQLRYFLIFILFLPIYAVGLATNFFPYIIPSKIFNIIDIDIEYKTSVQLGVGMLTFPLFYSLEAIAFKYYFHADSLQVFLFTLALPILGYGTMYYFTELKRFWRVIRFYWFFNQSRKVAMITLRDEIRCNIEAARKSLD